jgi:DNA repair protein RadC
MGHYLVSTGSVNKVIVDLRGIATAALKAGARAVILCHNHPSGNPQPSGSDRDQTDNLRQALSLLDIELLDHIVLGEDKYFSFAEETTWRYPKRIAC